MEPFLPRARGKHWDKNAKEENSFSLARMPPRFCCDVENPVLLDSFGRRNWIRVGPDDDWDFYWASSATVRSMFAAGVRLSDGQMVNHFPTHQELTRKDLLLKNLKHYTRKCSSLKSSLIPTSFLLPGEYQLFVEEFRRRPSTWIVKPAGKSQGAGIFLVHKLSQVKNRCHGGPAAASLGGAGERHVVSRYVERPLLVGGRKFDLRLYVLVTSFHPLRAYLYAGGFCRFCQARYSPRMQLLRDPLVHLTNVSVQKQGADYNGRHGGKWSLRSLQLYLEGCRGKESARGLGDGVRASVRHSLRAVAAVMACDPHCFECYGYDVLVDEDLHPWLMEVNASPSLSCTTDADRRLKGRLLDDLLRLLFDRRGPRFQPL